jgi:hypothetical protein
MTARTNPRDGAIGNRSSVEKDHGGHDEEDSKPFLVTGSSPIVASCPGQEEAVQEESKSHYKIPSGWKHVKLEPDC